MTPSLAFPHLIASTETITVNSGAGMNIVSWLILGLVAGFIASKLVNKSGEGILLGRDEAPLDRDTEPAHHAHARCGTRSTAPASAAMVWSAGEAGNQGGPPDLRRRP